MFFHNYNGRCVLFHLKDEVIDPYDSLQSKVIHPELHDVHVHVQMLSLYGNKVVKIHYVQVQKV